MYNYARYMKKFFSIKKVKSNACNDYLYFKSFPKQLREEQLQRIVNVPNARQNFTRTIPQFPEQYRWNYKGTQLQAYSWNRIRQPKGILVMFHALNGHTGNCGELASILGGQGIIVEGYDYENFGRSQGKYRGHILNVNELVQCSREFIIQIKLKYPGVKLFIGGLSLGGAITFKLSILYPEMIMGAVLLSPALRHNITHYPYMHKIVFLMGMIFPKMNFQSINGGRNGCKCSLKQYEKTDKYMQNKGLWTSTSFALIKNMWEIKKQFSKMSVPYILIQSGCDKIIDPFQAIDLQKQSISQDKTTIMIKNMWHSIWFDEHAPQVIQEIKNWILTRT